MYNQKQKSTKVKSLHLIIKKEAWPFKLGTYGLYSILEQISTVKYFVTPY